MPRARDLQHAHSGPGVRAAQSNRHTWISNTRWDAHTTRRAFASVVAVSPLGSSVEMETPVHLNPSFCPTRGGSYAQNVLVDAGYLQDVLCKQPCVLRAEGAMTAAGDHEDATVDCVLTLTLDDDAESYTGALAGLAEDAALRGELCNMFGPGNQSFINIVAFSADQRGPRASGDCVSVLS